MCETVSRVLFLASKSVDAEIGEETWRGSMAFYGNRMIRFPFKLDCEFETIVDDRRGAFVIQVSSAFTADCPCPATSASLRAVAPKQDQLTALELLGG